MDFDRQASSKADQAGSPLPGFWQSAIVAALSALVCGLWAFGRAAAPADTATASVSQLSEVAPEDIDHALETMDGPRDQLAQFRQRQACSHRLAWVAIARTPGQPAGKIRLQSGNYITLAFDLNETPTRIAIPYPARYAVGRGTLSVIGTGADATVALTPAWFVAAKGGAAAREVAWTPVGRCPANTD